MTGQQAAKKGSLEVVCTDRIASPIGWIEACWTEAGLATLTWEPADRAPAPRRMQAAGSGIQGLLPQRLAAYWRTGEADFLQIPIDYSGHSAFTIAVLELCRKIPPGATRTYGQLARQAGFERAARAVGRVMARNRVPLVIPCHRVVGASGKLVGYSGPGGTQLKQRLLDLERGLPAMNAAPAHR